jgi:Na+-translocating ferredoxin:NAD+ oxidoreductase RnfG subunit
MDRQLPVWASVALVVVISALLLVGTHLVTQVFAPPEGAVGKDSAQGEALPAAEMFVPVEISADTGLDNCYKGQAGGKTVGCTAQITVNGYGGPVEVVVGMGMDGILTGISVGGDQFNESPGLGAKTKDIEFRSQFVGITPPVSLNKGDATSSATQSGDWTATAAPQAAQTASADATSSATQSGDWTATAAPLAAQAAAADATSSATQSGDWSATAAPTATAESVATVEPASTVQPAASSGSTVDAVSGATITSTAVVEGVNKCAAFLMTLLMGGQL